MGSPSELSLECKPTSYSVLPKSCGAESDQSQKLEEFLARLEEEQLKIDAFKRELPLCMQLLNNAMETSRLQLEAYKTNQGSRPVLEEFIPIKHHSNEELDKATDTQEKANWMASAQLWSQAIDRTRHQAAMMTALEGKDSSFNLNQKLCLDNKQRNGGAFLPFSKEKNGSANSMIRVLPELALSSLNKDVEEEKKCLESEKAVVCRKRENCSEIGAGTTAEQEMSTTEAQAAPTQTHRKARRCWSPDLHRRFVNALQMLGGSQVATPKQIRELMKVDGLTNDEVKSHLQKYRLHTRRPSQNPQGSATPAPQLVVLGGIWVPPEYATAAAAAHGASPGLYAAHPSSHSSTHYFAPHVVQDFYPAPPHPFHHYRPPPIQTHSSPNSDVRDAGDRSESIEEEGKSDSSSWKGGESGDNENGGAKGLVALGEVGDESHGSDHINLKF